MIATNNTPINLTQAEISQIQNSQIELRINNFIQYAELKFKARELLLKGQSESTINFLEAYKRKFFETVPESVLKMKVGDFLQISGTDTFEEISEKVRQETLKIKESSRENIATEQKPDIYPADDFRNTEVVGKDLNSFDNGEKENKLDLANLQEEALEASQNFQTKKLKLPVAADKEEKIKTKFKKGGPAVLKKKLAAVPTLTKSVMDEGVSTRARPANIKIKINNQATTQSGFQNVVPTVANVEAGNQLGITTGVIKKPWLP